MPISYDADKQIFKLDTNSTSYCMQILEGGILAHLYYGQHLVDSDLSYLVRYKDRGFSGNPEGFFGRRSFSLDTIPQEYSGFNVGDYRSPSVHILRSNGSSETDFRYKAHHIAQGKYSLKDLPASWGKEGETLEITLVDPVSGAQATLLYGVFADKDILTRAVRIANPGKDRLRLQRAMSVCIDFPHSEFELLDLPGRYAMERQLQRSPLVMGKQCIESIRGASSHHMNPFMALLSPETTSHNGDCYGFSLVYSGNFLGEAEVSHAGTTRLTLGVNPMDFSWELAPGGSFDTPEVVMAYTNKGLNGMTQLYHRFFRENLLSPHWSDTPRPVVLNNWEATYFDFSTEKLIPIAKAAKEIGVDVFVLDDGWFGKRNSDTTSLGDWETNHEKLPGGLSCLIQEIHQLGMGFGIWVEPEMVSQDSELYRAHPDWCLHAPGRYKSTSRDQLVLDMSRQEIVDYLFDKLSALLGAHPIQYVKWDFNRHLTEVSSCGRPAENQRETWHRFILGTYQLFDRLTRAFPAVLFESCSGGGGRFDAGMLYYTPQIWASDNTDALERLYIQYGTALVYPLSSISAHVSAVPNHQTQCTTPLHTRGIVAMAGGAFGYEMDLSKCSPAEKEEMKQQIIRYKKDQHLVQTGTYYSLISPYAQKDVTVWSIVSADQTSFIVSGVWQRSQAYALLQSVKLVGLLPNKQYLCAETGEAILGDTLMKAGFNLPDLSGYGAAFSYHFSVTA